MFLPLLPTRCCQSIFCGQTTSDVWPAARPGQSHSSSTSDDEEGKAQAADPPTSRCCSCPDEETANEAPAPKQSNTKPYFKKEPCLSLFLLIKLPGTVWFVRRRRQLRPVEESASNRLQHRNLSARCQKTSSTHTPCEEEQRLSPTELRTCSSLASSLKNNERGVQLKKTTETKPHRSQVVSVHRFLWQTRWVHEQPGIVDEKRDICSLCMLLHSRHKSKRAYKTREIRSSLYGKCLAAFPDSLVDFVRRLGHFDGFSAVNKHGPVSLRQAQGHIKSDASRAAKTLQNFPLLAIF